MSALDGIGSIVGAANVPAPQPGQATENKWSLGSGFYFAGDHLAFGVIALDTEGSRRYATIALNHGPNRTGTRRVEFSWEANRFYFPVALISGAAIQGFVYDYTANAWTFIGSLPLPPSYGRIYPVSTTYLWWYGAGAPDCASYPRVDHYRYAPVGIVNGLAHGVPSTAVSDETTGSGCPATVAPGPDPSWRHYTAGSTAGPTVEWARPNFDDANTRESRLSAITSQSVASLSVAWTASATGTGVFGAFGGMNPIVVDGTMYFQDLKSNVYAVDAATGAPRWKRDYGAAQLGPNGPAVDGGRVFVTSSMNTVAALDASTGAELWSKTIANSDTQGITIQMAAAEGTLYFSTVPAPSVDEFYPPGGMGILYALDQATGDEKWSFNTVKDGDLWGHPEINSGGGSWYPPAIDHETGITYWATGNPAPFPGNTGYPNGSSRPGPNLYTNSMLAMDADGDLLWYRQVTPHDLFDYDFEAPPILTTATLGGVERKLVVGAGKAGRVLAFDAMSGDVIWDVAVGVHSNDDLTTLPTTPLVISPGFIGGVMSPMALSDGVVYVPVANTQATYTATGHTASLGGTGQVVALDVRTGQRVWNADLGSPIYAGATVTRDLVVTATMSGRVVAFDKATGRQVWSWQAGGGINAPIAVTGDSLLVPVGMGASPGVVSLRLTAT
ncbi:MAG: PQQ-binding-like beta-propeller repeat protein [Acidimicrobiales bacterium]